ncbi:LOW QUALITY PROTEIN: dead end protein 1 [Gymnodraco acuticeps]|uniref:LOW QUALITY PROTEIN: dead end protein 1 n=1 Tax=Gymnodraco acuticeps TaxID=8218 RepID=A0A6P8VRX9_GYMAC|nr:LOW QUALITY PROTEIN: dead end protein 1 [Gymnodraco acuticeps]
MEVIHMQVLNSERLQALEAWLMETDTKLAQVNGQRKYGGPPAVWHLPPPGSGCEVFISQIPRDTYEDVLIPLFGSVGPLWEFRLMMNFSGQNRGFAYAKYSSPVVANGAVRLLNGHRLEAGPHLSVRLSTEKSRLCIGELPASTQLNHLLQVLRGMADGVERISLKAGPGIVGVSAIVVFSSHYDASMAKRVLVEAFKKLFQLKISLKWQSTMKSTTDEPPPSTQLSKSLFPTPLKLPRHVLTPPSPPPRLARLPSRDARELCKAVGEPPQTPPPPSSSSLEGYRPCPMVLLCELCETKGVGKPQYKIKMGHVGARGFICFIYEVSVPGITPDFEGQVVILPRSSAYATVDEARKAVALQVLHKICN